jgi:hypothetical protein
MLAFTLNTDLIPKENTLFIVRRVLSFLLTFYISYLVVHFFFLNEFGENPTLLIIIKVWTGQMLLNIVSLMISKDRTFGDVVFGIKYQSLIQGSSQEYLLLKRSTFTLILFYSTIYVNSQFGFASYSIVLSVLLAVALNWPYLKIKNSRLTLLDRFTGCLAVKTKMPLK